MRRVFALFLIAVLVLSGCGQSQEASHTQTPTVHQTQASTEAPTTEAPVTEEPVTETPTTQAPTTEDPVTEIPTETQSQTAVDAPVDQPPELVEGTDYVLNMNTMKFHHTWCKSVKDIKPSNRKDYTGTRDEVLSMGYVPCKNCDP